jgi:KipI family sensor histidine kinase inhibitor
VREAGDAGLLLELEPVIDAAINARAIGIADALRRRRIEGIRDIVPTYRSVAVHFDPSVTSPTALRDPLTQAVREEHPLHDGRLIEIPVVYGGEHGPDLAEVAQWAGMSPDMVIDRHAGVDYRVFMFGFLPGFAYLGTVDERIAAARRATPRVKVAVGSVGVAGRQTGIYPCESPGGWQILGRTAVRMFDPAKPEPALCAPGDRVRFIPERTAAFPAPRTADQRPPASAQLTVIRPGLLTTVQDEGRWGHQAEGVPVAGAMDVDAARRANALVGNDRRAAVLETTLLGPELRVESDVTLAVAGADLSGTIDGRPLPLNAAVRASAGATIRFGQRVSGGRAYLAFRGGIDVPMVLGSRATHTRSGMGGLDGRPLRAGDRLSLGKFVSDVPVRQPIAPTPPLPPPGQMTTLRVLPGPQRDWFDEGAFELLQRTTFSVHPQSDRMGLRLSCETSIPRRSQDVMISDATFPGALQVPSSGQPILLLADRPTTGGYPQIAVVISADLGRAGQLLPGDRVRFEMCSMQAARAALDLTSPERSHGDPGRPA